MRDVSNLDPTIDYTHGLGKVAEDLKPVVEAAEQLKQRLERVHQRARERELLREVEKESQ